MTRFGMGFGMLALMAAAAVGCNRGADAAKAAEDGDVGTRPTPAVAAPTSAPAAAAAPAAEGKHGRAGGDAPRRSEDRPGLGTEWGETRGSQVSTVSFTRADVRSPFATSSVFYNDEQGARAMASSEDFRRTSSPTTMANGAFTVGLRDESGRFLSGYAANGKEFAVGEAGQRYTIVLKNDTDLRFEAVVSVDGLDVMDGRTASFAKRGYIVDAHRELEVDGFRQSNETVAAFRFGSVKSSYANQKHGDTRNVGVIGVALFHERGTNPFLWARNDSDRRREANPFPGRFASPP